MTDALAALPPRLPEVTVRDTDVLAEAGDIAALLRWW
jgi:hypothetical protein